MRLLTAIFYISLILIIAKCNSSGSLESETKRKMDTQIHSDKVIHSIEELASESNKSFFLDSVKEQVIIVSSMDSDQPKTLDFLLGNRQPRPILK